MDLEKLQRFKQILSERRNADEPAFRPEEESIPEDIMSGIIQKESSGRANVTGDQGAKAGVSRGLMQIQDRTGRELLKKGLLPNTWNDKKVKKSDLPMLMMDPEFNKIAGTALYNDNKRILRKKATQHGRDLSEDELNDLTTKAHNQGVTRTIKRDLLGQEPLNPKVQKYLDDVRGRTQQFADGGLVDPITGVPYEEIPNDPAMADIPVLQPAIQAPIEPTASPSPADPYQQLMDEYRAEKEAHANKQGRAKWADLGTDLSNALLKYGVQSAAGKAQQAGGMKLDTPQLGLKAGANVRDLGKGPSLAEKMQQLKMMQAAKARGAGGVKPLSEYQKQSIDLKKDAASEKKLDRQYKKEQDILDREFQEKRFVDKVNARDAKSIGSGDTDPKSEASATARKEAEFLTGRKFPESFSEAKINRILTSLAIKLESRYQTKRYGLSKDRLEQAGEKIGLAKEKEGQRKTEKALDIKLKADKNIYNVTKDFEGNALKKELDKQGISFEQANGLISEIKTGNELALGSLGTKMARAMGEVGVLTDADVVRYIQSQSIVRQGRDMYARKGQGRLYDDTLKDMERVIKKMQGGFRVREKEIFERYTKRAHENFGKQAGLSKEDIYTRFGMQYRLPKKAPSDTIIIKQISTGKTKRVSKDAAKKYKDNPNFEVVK